MTAETVSLIDLAGMFPDEETARLWFEKARWPNGVQCAYCDSGDMVDQVPNLKPMPWRCADCKRYFSVRTHTVMARSPLPYKTWAYAMFLITTAKKGISSHQLARDLGITQKSAWYLGHRIRDAMAASGELPRMKGPVEVDETFVGGKYSNMHSAKRRQKPEKFPVIGVLDRETGEVRAMAVDSIGGDTLPDFVERHVKWGAVVNSDDAAFYRELPRRGYIHGIVSHSTGQFVDGHNHTQGIESHWATIKRAYKGAFHWLSRKHLQRYVDEFSFKATCRDIDTHGQMLEIAWRMQGRSLTWAALVG
ncbi:MAG: IS1595 family transposase [Chloroflexota bacterium]|nr:IS1595 family transposase [Chloroflexota bacterium]